MKVNFFMLFISLVICGLIFFGFYTWGNENLLFTLGTSLVSLVLVCSGMAISNPGAPRGNVMVKVVSWIFFIGLLATDIILAGHNVADATFVIINGIALCIWAVIAYGIGRTKQ